VVAGDSSVHLLVIGPKPRKPRSDQGIEAESPRLSGVREGPTNGAPTNPPFRTSARAPISARTIGTPTPPQSRPRACSIALQLDRSGAPAFWVYRPVRRSSPNTSGRKPLKNPGLAGGSIGFKSPSSHCRDAGRNMADGLGIEVKRFTSGRVFPGSFGFFWASDVPLENAAEALCRQHLRAFVGLPVVGCPGSSNLPPPLARLFDLPRVSRRRARGLRKVSPKVAPPTLSSAPVGNATLAACERVPASNASWLSSPCM
jgi:hypothetical protein